MSETRSDDVTGDPRASRIRAIRWIFVEEQGIRAGWSALIFAATFWGLNTAVNAALGHFFSLDPKGPMPLSIGLVGACSGVLVVVAATLLMARIESRPLFSYGFAGDHRAIRLVSGAVWGFLCLSLLIGILWKTGFLGVDGFALGGFGAWEYAVGWGLVFLLVGVFEESLLRGYMQHVLTKGIGFWWAALVLSVVFALGHLGNSGESPWGIFEVFTAGFIFCLSLWYTKSLWWAVGFHAGWDWGQSYFYGSPDSGWVVQNHLLATHASGNPLWSGGAVGPEGSLVILPLVAMVATGMWVWWGVRQNGSSW